MGSRLLTTTKRSGYFCLLISRIPILGQHNTRGAPIHIHGIWKGFHHTRLWAEKFSKIFSSKI